LKKLIHNIAQIFITGAMLFLNVEANQALASALQEPLQVNQDFLLIDQSISFEKEEQVVIEVSEDLFMKLPERPPTFVTPETMSVNHREFCAEYNMYDHSPLTGFIDDWGFCVPGLVTNEVWFTPSPQYVYGTAVYYNPGLMRATAKWRSLEMFNLAYRSEEYLGGVAVPSPANIGDTVWLRRSGGEWTGPYLVVDCSRRADVYTHIAINQQVVEVDFKTALAWGLVEGDYESWNVIRHKEQTVEVWYGENEPNEDVALLQRPVYFSDYWLENVAEFQREKIEPSPIYYPDGLNPLWDLRDGNGKQCFTATCLGKD
jgi:hypothetical protein